MNILVLRNMSSCNLITDNVMTDVKNNSNNTTLYIQHIFKQCPNLLGVQYRICFIGADDKHREEQSKQASTAIVEKSEDLQQ